MPPSELIVLSHLRWDWVWQRPQQLISRLARGRRTVFVEEPRPADIAAPTLRTADAGPVTRVWLEVPDPHHPDVDGLPHLMSFDEPLAGGYGDTLAERLGTGPDRVVWLYTPLALDVARRLTPDVLVYDVMDDLASFRFASPELKLRHRQALRTADLVFAGGRSLYAGVTAHRTNGVHLFPSGVDSRHYAAARAVPRDPARPVAGYVGVLDERLDLRLVADLASHLPDWEIRMVGPVYKIAAAKLPDAANIRYLGAQPYERLPELMSGFDVALMPFALTEATRSISPTKTLEYLAAGLPVVSTRVADVVTDFSGVVEVADDGAAFAEACIRLRAGGVASPERVASLVRSCSWDVIASRMDALIRMRLTARASEETA